MKWFARLLILYTLTLCGFAQTGTVPWSKIARDLGAAADVKGIRFAGTVTFPMDHTGSAGYKSQFRFDDDGTPKGYFGIDKDNDGTRQFFMDTAITLRFPAALGLTGDCIVDTNGAGLLGFATCTAGSAGGWSDDGVSVRLSTSTDTVTIGSNTAAGSNTKLAVVGNAITISASPFTADASLHINGSYGGNDRLTQMNPTSASKPALNLMASLNGSSTAQWYSWGVDTDNIFKIMSGTSFGGTPVLGVTTANVVVGGGATAAEMRLMEPSGSGTNYSGFKAVATTANLIWSLPSADASGCVQSNGSLVLSISTCPSSTNYWSRTGTTLTPATSGDLVNFSDGASNGPSISFAGDTDTGIYHSTNLVGIVAQDGASGSPTFEFTGTNYQPQLTLRSATSGGGTGAILNALQNNSAIGPLHFYGQAFDMASDGGSTPVYIQILGSAINDGGTPSTHGARIWVDTNGASSKHRLVVKFGSGAVQVIASEP